MQKLLTFILIFIYYTSVISTAKIMKYGFAEAAAFGDEDENLVGWMDGWNAFSLIILFLKPFLCFRIQTV